MNQLNVAEQLQLLAITPAALATVTGVTVGVDVSSFVGRGVIVLSSAAGTGTTPTLDAKLQEADTLGGTYTDVVGGGFTQLTTTAGLQRANIDLELVLREGIARFINNNLDVLAPNEIEKFKNVLLLKPKPLKNTKILEDIKEARKRGFQRISEDAEMFELAEQGLDDFISLTNNYETT